MCAIVKHSQTHTFSSVRRRYRQIKYKEPLRRIKQYVNAEGTKAQKLQKGDDFVNGEFLRARAHYLPIHDSDLRRLASKSISLCNRRTSQMGEPYQIKTPLWSKTLKKVYRSLILGKGLSHNRIAHHTHSGREPELSWSKFPREKLVVQSCPDDRFWTSLPRWIEVTLCLSPSALLTHWMNTTIPFEDESNEQGTIFLELQSFRFSEREDDDKGLWRNDEMFSRQRDVARWFLPRWGGKVPFGLPCR